MKTHATATSTDLASSLKRYFGYLHSKVGIVI